MTLELSAVLPRICFACVVGLIFFLILRSEIANWTKIEEGAESEEKIVTRSSVTTTRRVKRHVSTEIESERNLENTTNLKLYAVIVNQVEDADNLTQIRREIEENRFQTDALFWLVLGTAVCVVTFYSFAAAYWLLRSRGSFSCFSRSRAHRDAWWETKDEDYLNYASFVRQNTKLIEDVEPIDGAAIYVDPKYASPRDKRRSRHLSTIDENGESSDGNGYKHAKRIVKTEYTVDLTPGVKGTYIIPDLNSKGKARKIWKTQMISLLYSAPDFRGSGMPCVCIPSK